MKFLEPVPQQIYALGDKPRYPGSAGYGRTVTDRDAALFAEWMMAFYQETDRDGPSPSREELQRVAGEGNFLFWIDAERPVPTAEIVRRLKNSAAIMGVYTPPELRRRGYAGSATAAAVERIHAEGRKTACLGNPASNRCSTKIGFSPICRSLHFHRDV